MTGFNGEDLTLLSWPSFLHERRDLFTHPVLDNNNSLKCLKHCDHEEIQFARTYRVIYENKVKLKFGMTFFLIWNTPELFFLYMDFSYKGFAIYKFFNEIGGPLFTLPEWLTH